MLNIIHSKVKYEYTLVFNEWVIQSQYLKNIETFDRKKITHYTLIHIGIDSQQQKNKNIFIICILLLF